MQADIIAQLGVKAEIDPAAEIERRVAFLMAYCRHAHAKGFVLGISGGQDSTLAGRLVQLAVEGLRAQGYEATFVAMRLPYQVQGDEADAQAALTFIQADRTMTIDVAGATDALVEAFTAQGQGMGDFNKGNIKARMRMVAQYALAGEYGYLVVGTDHAAEAVTGFYTKFGDGAADLMPLAGLTKAQGAQLLAHLGAPAALWEKVPTADLLDGQPGRPDEEELGITYAQIDTYLTGGQIVAAARTNLEGKFVRSAHKRALPPGPDWLDRIAGVPGANRSHEGSDADRLSGQGG